ncbi:max-like protein X isoform X1 [Equus asinus]|uniref:Max-like protein X n=1 Tax=Equus asinus TaxID=9793 RepID=A0A8C4LPJ8_EQUAS|nr:max-like protein X isoform X1 [Equus quagga]
MCFVSRRQGPTGRTSLKPPMLAQRQARPALRRRGPRAAHAPHPRPALRLSAVGWWAGVTWARLASSSRLRAGPRAGFRFGGSEMTEPGASPEDPWVKASPVGAHAGEGRAGGARARRGAGGRGNSLQSLKSPLLSRPRGCREDSSHPACAKVEYAYSDNSLDPGLFVESTRKGSVVSRANSIGSTSASSVPNTDDEDSDYHQESYKESYKDRRRRAHTQAEQKRRDAIKRGYDDLQTIVPTCQQQDFSIGSQKLSKAIVLQKTIDYIQFLHKEKKKQEEEVSILRKEVTALKIMKVNYEQIVKAHQDNPHEGEDQVSDQVKFNVFQGIMDSLFQSFNASISVASFQELSACVFSWIEEHCKPQTLREIVIGVLHQLKNQLY